MRILSELHKRRVIPWMGAYLAGGFIALEGVTQLIDYQFVPAVIYPITLVFYLFGVPSTMVLAWFHGEKGVQKPPRSEIWIHALLLVGAIATSTVAAGDYNARQGPPVDVLAEAGLDPRGVAVRYFEDYSDGDLAYLADGLTEALIDELRGVRALSVISANGVGQFRDPDIPSDSVARALGVANLVAGSVEAAGDEIRITTRLVEGLSGADISRETIRMPAGRFVATQDSVVTVVALSLRERLGDEVQLRAGRSSTSSDEAWALVQRASRLERLAADSREAHDLSGALEKLEEAHDLLSQAAVLDPNWVEVESQQAVIFHQLARYVWDRDDIPAVDGYIDSGLEHANRALEREAREPTALEYRGRLQYLSWLVHRDDHGPGADRLLAAARRDLEAATEVAPNPASAYSALSHLRSQLADRSGVLIAARRAYEEDAYLRDANAVLLRLTGGHHDLEQIPEAHRWCLEGARRFPSDPLFVECQLYTMIHPTALAPDVDRAWELAERYEELSGEHERGVKHAVAHTLVGGVLLRDGQADSANAVIERARLSPAEDPEMEALLWEAKIRSVMGEHQQAIDLMARFITAHPSHAFQEGTDFHWWWRPLRDYPEFQSLVDRRAIH